MFSHTVGLEIRTTVLEDSLVVTRKIEHNLALQTIHACENSVNV